jgi:hypothetical protein
MEETSISLFMELDLFYFNGKSPQGKQILILKSYGT